MIDMSNREFVAGLKSNFHSTFDSPQGKEVLHFLEVSCKWYQSVWDSEHPDMTLINDGKRQVVATIKTILELSPDQLVELAKKSGG